MSDNNEHDVNKIKTVHTQRACKRRGRNGGTTTNLWLHNRYESAQAREREMTNRTMLENPANLCDLYFNVSELNKELGDEFYVHSDVEVSTESVCHGRGMIATQDIQAGTLLFVTPPTVYSNQGALQKLFTKNESNNSLNLEEIAMDLLVDNMWNCIEQEKLSTVNSFLALMGVSNTKAEQKRVTIDTLNAKDNTEHHTQDDLKLISKQDLKNIILKNGTCTQKLVFCPL